MRRRQKHDGRYGGGATGMDGTGLDSVYTCEPDHLLEDVHGAPANINRERVADQTEGISRATAPHGKSPYFRRRS